MANLAKRVARGSAKYSDFWYGPNRERLKQVAKKDASTTETTLYVGGAYERPTRVVSGATTTEHVYYVRGAGETVAVFKRSSAAPTTSTRYLHRDHLGSVVALTNESGGVVERLSYDPWGKRRDAASWVTPAPGTFSFDPAFSDRGYTGHEHADHVGLVNMNGRVYDPELGKFLSADPFVQFPESTQGHNRYAYVGNNPLSYIDPSGFFSLKDVMKVVGVAMFIFQPQFAALWQQILWNFVSGSLILSGSNAHGSASASATGAWQNGGLIGLPRGPPAATGTPGFNPLGGHSLSPQASADPVAGPPDLAQRIYELLVQAASAARGDDASARSNAEGKSAGGAAAGTGSFEHATLAAVGIEVLVGAIPGVGTIVGAYEAYRVLADPSSSGADRVIAVVGVLPGGRSSRSSPARRSCAEYSGRGRPQGACPEPGATSFPIKRPVVRLTLASPAIFRSDWSSMSVRADTRLRRELLLRRPCLVVGRRGKSLSTSVFRRSRVACLPASQTQLAIKWIQLGRSAAIFFPENDFVSN